jgi:hypothetical protein
MVKKEAVVLQQKVTTALSFLPSFLLSFLLSLEVDQKPHFGMTDGW